MNKGFSLIELAASMLIIALIIAGITSGASLVRQAEMRSVIADFQSFRTAYRDFTIRYKQIPGDMANASSFWGGTTCHATVPANCNGDGDARIEAIWNNSTDETAKAWKHLSLAQLIPQGINVIPAAYVGSIIIGDLAPAGKVSGSGFWMASGSDIGRNQTGGSVIVSPWSADPLINAVFMGRKSAYTINNGLTYGAVSASYAFNIDRKIDDGTTDTSYNSKGYNTGKIRAVTDSTFANCISGGTYVITSSAESCLLGYQLNDR
jgi:prepilin-type N-terminal cleavage/methylation domain-containing protein